VAGFDANLGILSSDGSGSPTTLTLTTTGAAAVNTRIAVFISYFLVAGITIGGVTVGGTAATRDLRAINSNARDGFDIWSVPKAAGLALSSAIAVTTSGGGFSGTFISALSLSGVDLTNGGGVAGTGSSNAQTGTGWSSGTASAAGGIAVGGAGNETLTTSETATASAGTLVHHTWLSTAQQGIATAYIIGGTNVAGTFASSSTATTGAIVAYIDAVPAGTLYRRFGPRFVRT
jgi:hypothetical protein